MCSNRPAELQLSHSEGSISHSSYSSTLPPGDNYLQSLGNSVSCNSTDHQKSVNVTQKLTGVGADEKLELSWRYSCTSYEERMRLEQTRLLKLPAMLQHLPSGAGVYPSPLISPSPNPFQGLPKRCRTPLRRNRRGEHQNSPPNAPRLRHQVAICRALRQPHTDLAQPLNVLQPERPASSLSASKATGNGMDRPQAFMNSASAACRGWPHSIRDKTPSDDQAIEGHAADGLRNDLSSSQCVFGGSSRKILPSERASARSFRHASSKSAALDSQVAIFVCAVHNRAMAFEIPSSGDHSEVEFRWLGSSLSCQAHSHSESKPH